MEWIFAFIWFGQVHATGMLFNEADCRDMLEWTKQSSVCINIKRPSVRIYKQEKLNDPSDF